MHAVAISCTQWTLGGQMNTSVAQRSTTKRDIYQNGNGLQCSEKKNPPSRRLRSELFWCLFIMVVLNPLLGGSSARYVGVNLQSPPCCFAWIDEDMMEEQTRAEKLKLEVHNCD
jgi:hypothetical protein